ncbi:MAG TPA: ABC transporter substrate-binding protein [Noviherbaspirillum sp.]
MRRAFSIKAWLLVLAALVMVESVVAQPPVMLRIESWRYDDLPVWRDRIIPAFEKAHPNIKVEFTPTAPERYNATIAARLKAGAAGDLVTCRAFDEALQLYQKGYLSDLDGLAGLANFTSLAKTAWTTDDGRTTFCVPIASVIHGFVYNKNVFARLGVAPPATVEQFFAVLEKIRKDRRYVPLAIGTHDTWEAATLGYQNIGPTYYKGEDGRRALIAGKAKLTDPEWVEPFRMLARWRPFLGEGFEAQTYTDSQVLFTLGLAAIYPAGSWEIADFEKFPFKLGAFPPPVQKQGDKCYISDHPDIAMGMNAKSKHPAEARAFLEFVASQEFAVLYSNALPGFFSLNKSKVELRDPLAQEFAGWRGRCESTVRPTYQILSRGTPNLEDDFWVKSAAVINGTLSPEAAAEQLQTGLARWYGPQMEKSLRRRAGSAGQKAVARENQ